VKVAGDSEVAMAVWAPKDRRRLKAWLTAKLVGGEVVTVDQVASAEMAGKAAQVEMADLSLLLGQRLYYRR
jgi:hypothetical protein